MEKHIQQFSLEKAIEKEKAFEVELFQTSPTYQKHVFNSSSARACKKPPMENLVVSKSREYGVSKALIELAKNIGLEKTIYSKPVEWSQNALAIIVGRIMYPDLILTHKS